METTQLLTDQAPPEILMMSDDADKKLPSSNGVSPTESGSVTPADETVGQAVVEPSSTLESVPGLDVADSARVEEIPVETVDTLKEDDDVSQAVLINVLTAPPPPVDLVR